MTLRSGARVLAVALVTLFSLVAPVTGSDAGAPPQVSMRTTVLQPPARLAAAAVGADGWTELAPIPAGDTITVGADWGGDPEVQVQVRALDGRRWTDWYDLAVDTDHAPDPADLPAGMAVSTATDPVWFGRSDQLQLRVRGPARAIELTRLDAPAGGRWLPPMLRPGAAVAATEQPQVLPRSSWGADESIRRYTPREFNRDNFAIVHHTASRNDYTQDEVAGIIQSFYAYHVIRKGWDDIAYNFLVDRFGTVWEGRHGGIGRPVIGSHASGFNGGSIGIAAIGNFQASEPTPALIEGLTALTAWKLDLHHIDPHGETEEIAGGGSSNRFAAGTRLTLPTIIGHRRTNNTTCPGELLYSHVTGTQDLPSLADRVDEAGHPKAYGGPPLDREQPLDGIRPRWDVTFTAPVTWQLAIVDDQGEPVRRGTGQADADLSLEWDLRDDAGELVAPGEYLAQLDATEVSGRRITPVRTRFEVTPAATRHSGTSRWATAAALSAKAFKQNERVVIASAEAFPDALVAGPLAGSLDAPILLVPSWGVPPEVADEIRRLHASKATIVGGKGRIPDAVEAGLREAGITSIGRLAGADRYETAAEVARFLINRDHPREALLALGEHPVESRAFPDALSAGAFGASRIAPVLLVTPKEVPGPVDAVLGQRPWFDGLVVFGGLGAIPEEVVDTARAAAGRHEAAADGTPAEVDVLRLAGTNRYETSTLAAEELLRRVAADLEEKGPSPYAEPTGLEVFLASGTNWPDALGAGAAAARRGAVFVLVAPGSLEDSPSTRDWLAARSADLAHAAVSGGAGAVSDEVLAQVGALVRLEGPSSQPGEPWPGEGGTSALPFPLPFFPPDDPEPEPSPEPTAEPTDPEPTDPEPTDPEPTDPEPTDPTPTAGGLLGPDAPLEQGGTVG